MQKPARAGGEAQHEKPRSKELYSAPSSTADILREMTKTKKQPFEITAAGEFSRLSIEKMPKRIFESGV